MSKELLVVCWSKLSEKSISRQMKFSSNLPIYAPSFLINYLYKLLVRLILRRYMFQNCLVLFVVLCQFYRHQVSGSIAKTDLKQKKLTEGLIRVIQVIEDILLLPNVLLIMIQVIKKCETNGPSSFQVNRITCKYI